MWLFPATSWKCTKHVDSSVYSLERTRKRLFFSPSFRPGAVITSKRLGSVSNALYGRKRCQSQGVTFDQRPPFSVVSVRMPLWQPKIANRRTPRSASRRMKSFICPVDKKCWRNEIATTEVLMRGTSWDVAIAASSEKSPRTSKETRAVAHLETRTGSSTRDDELHLAQLRLRTGLPFRTESAPDNELRIARSDQPLPRIWRPLQTGSRRNRTQRSEPMLLNQTRAMFWGAATVELPPCRVRPLIKLSATVPLILFAQNRDVDHHQLNWGPDRRIVVTASTLHRSRTIKMGCEKTSIIIFNDKPILVL